MSLYHVRGSVFGKLLHIWSPAFGPAICLEIYTIKR